jgi:hypothetical protein
LLKDEEKQKTNKHLKWGGDIKDSTNVDGESFEGRKKWLFYGCISTRWFAGSAY